VIYSEEERRIYTCPATGGQFDPLALRRVFRIRSEYNKALTDMGSEDDAVAASAEGTVVSIGRQAFGLRPVNPNDGTGVTDAIVLEAVSAFTRWLKGKGQTAQSGPNSAPCSGCP
jgi:hypothetical protein